MLLFFLFVVVHASVHVNVCEFQEGYQFSPTALAADTVTHIHLHPMQQQRQHIDAIQVCLQW